MFMKPGKPFNFATSGDTLIFSLPGNPVSALVGFEVFIRPALRSMLGASQLIVLELECGSITPFEPFRPHRVSAWRSFASTPQVI